MSAKIQIIFYSMYGHIYQMAQAVAAGAREAGAGEVSLWQVPVSLTDREVTISHRSKCHDGRWGVALDDNNSLV